MRLFHDDQLELGQDVDRRQAQALMLFHLGGDLGARLLVARVALFQFTGQCQQLFTDLHHRQLLLDQLFALGLDLSGHFACPSLLQRAHFAVHGLDFETLGERLHHGDGEFRQLAPLRAVWFGVRDAPLTVAQDGAGLALHLLDGGMHLVHQDAPGGQEEGWAVNPLHCHAGDPGLAAARGYLGSDIAVAHQRVHGLGLVVVARLVAELVHHREFRPQGFGRGLGDHLNLMAQLAQPLNDQPHEAGGECLLVPAEKAAFAVPVPALEARHVLGPLDRVAQETVNLH